MNVTVVKKYKGQAVVTGNKNVKDIEDLIIFTTAMGVTQNFEEFVQDFQENKDRTYIVELTYEH